MKNRLVLLFLIILLVTSCALQQRRRFRGSEQYEQSRIVEPDTTIIPSFDVEVLYVLAREYENAQDTLRSMGEYVEERLIELYPEKAYRGMMSKVAEATMEQHPKSHDLQQFRHAPKYETIDGQHSLFFRVYVNQQASLDVGAVQAYCTVHTGLFIDGEQHLQRRVAKRIGFQHRQRHRHGDAVVTAQGGTVGTHPFPIGVHV